ncbi:hypothetical protein [Sorangium sp. So ce388]|uniref:hypothetical protein n=1 Tax=Sorangium sp. So ce388 TaxID=3133309 RepID=UPI003F5B9B7E
MPSEGQDWAADDSCGVFVSATRGDDENGGAPGAPVKTLARAIELASEHEGRVYACAETFEEVLTVTEGMFLYGGLDCAASWQWDGKKRTTLTTPQDAAAGTVPLTMRAVGETVWLEDIDVTAPSIEPSNFGVSSIAAIADRCQVKLTRCTLTAGEAAPGASGASPEPARATDGGKGSDGNEACSADIVETDAPPLNECGTPDNPSDDSRGGLGGSGNSSIAGNGGNGSPGEQINPNRGTYSAGPDGRGRCFDGGEGAAGSHGDEGAGARGIGALNSTGYTGVAGNDGTDGKTAQGGGGGAGSRGGIPPCPNGDSNGGASGGSGGAGGCGGRGGRGGGPGGSSIALVSLDAKLSFQDVRLEAQRGGDGGNGASGQQGGSGGPGGQGGFVAEEYSTDLDFPLKPGCRGGAGGHGGNGGWGGGGLGGHSLGVAFRDPAGTPPSLGNTVIQVGAPGAGGTGSDSDATGNGDPGMALETLPFP